MTIVSSHLLEVGKINQPMSTRLIEGARQINQCIKHGIIDGSVLLPRPDQSSMIQDFADYLNDQSTRPAAQKKIRIPMARLVAPPRTGKLVLVGFMVRGTGLTATIVTSTKTLVDQAARELRRQLPGVPIGEYYSEVKNLVHNGVNVVTYSILQHYWKEHETLPEPIRNSALIFVDEGHHSMTPGRIKVLKKGFDSRAIRMALTATPNYSAQRMLHDYFPDLIHEITIQEAMELELLAPLRVWVHEVDVDASEVQVVADNFEEDTLGKIMTAAPFLRAAELYRYDPENAGTPALICCVSRQQAYDLYKYLKDHHPKDSPEPQLILGETPKVLRQEILRQYEAGEIDTLIIVKTLIEGWNSPRCKLLIDLAPSLSLVNATQKFFRCMTKFSEQEAKIYIFVPNHLASHPILPMELLGWETGTMYRSGQLITSSRNKRKQKDLPALNTYVRSPVEQVQLKTNVLVSTRFEKPKLNPQNLSQVKEVMLSNNSFDPLKPCGMYNFRGLFFNHPLFSGRGEQLLRLLKYPTNRQHYLEYMARLFPEGATYLYFLQLGWGTLREGVVNNTSIDEELEEINTIFRKRIHSHSGCCYDPKLEYGFAALAGRIGRESEYDIDDALWRHWLVNTMLAAGPRVMKPREWIALSMLWGLKGMKEHSLDEIAEALGGYSRARAGQLTNKGLYKLQRYIIHNALPEGEKIHRGRRS